MESQEPVSGELILANNQQDTLDRQVVESDAKYDAWRDLMEFLEPNEEVEKIIFGAWGWGSSPKSEQAWKLGYKEPDPPFVPFVLRHTLMTAAQAEPFMHGWSFRCGFGAPMCYATYIWTTQRVITVSEYDGKTGLHGTPRHPTEMNHVGMSGD